MTFRYSKLKLFYDMLDLIKNNLFILFILFLNAGSNSMFMNIVQWGAVNYHFISEQKRHFFAHSFRKPSPLF
ncbi:hypothetical protein AA904_15480 [Geobacillus stearothermophilus]|nr:hypothetical protein AA904_15480 [Geobacillus stearothermophilus]KMY56779.1 hypothetical protein AA905_15715 [Geobacillus stearothermophilus]